MIFKKMEFSSNCATDLLHVFNSSYWTNYIARVHWKESNCPSLVHTLHWQSLTAARDMVQAILLYT